MSQPKIILHHLNASRSDRLFWLLEELELPYDVKVYYRLPTRAAPPELKQVSPFGKAPTIQVNDQTLTESGYITHHLTTHYPSNNIEPTPSESSIFWSHFSEGSMMTLFQGGAAVGAMVGGFGKGLFGQVGEDEKKGVERFGKFFTEQYLKPQSQAHLDEVEKFLSGHPGQFFSGNDKPGQGDFMMFFPINSLLAGTRKDAGFKVGPATTAWWEMVTSRPACKKGLERLRAEEEAGKSKI